MQRRIQADVNTFRKSLDEMVKDLGNLDPQGIVTQQYKRLQAQIGLTILASIQLESLPHNQFCISP